MASSRSPGKKCNKTGLAEIFGVNTQTVDAWVRKGCPVEQVGSQMVEWIFDSAAIAQWRIDWALESLQERLGKSRTPDGADDLAEAKRRKAVADAANAELDLAIKRGDAISIDDASKLWGNLVSSCRAKLLSIGAKTAPLLAAEDDIVKTRQLVDDAVHEALEELANFDPEQLTEDQ